LSALAVFSAVEAAPTGFDMTTGCVEPKANHGCDSFCGYEAVKAADDWICMPSAPKTKFPFPLEDGDIQEYCALVAANSGCSDICAYKFDVVEGGCRTTLSAIPAAAAALGKDAPIIGGTGKYRYQYMPELLKMDGASLVNCHGLVTDKDKNIYLTYQNDGKDPHCLIKWKPDGTGGEFMTGGDAKGVLCGGTPHGLKITTEGDEQFLYHANNNQKLTKTKMDGTVVWQTLGNFGQDSKLPYRPTWFATPPNSNFTYMCDGYGSNNIYPFDRNTGKWQDKKVYGGHSPGKGPTQPHGTFSTNHGCTWDPRTNDNTIVVSDRANSRFEFFHYDPATVETFEWYKTADMQPYLGTGTLPCNLRMYPDLGGIAITPDLAGPVGVLNSDNEVVSVVNVSVLLAAEQHKHPHDAMFLPNGDMVVATWAPGRISYWKLLPVEDEVAEM